jgi:hypothetical protein
MNERMPEFHLRTEILYLQIYFTKYFNKKTELVLNYYFFVTKSSACSITVSNTII